MAQIPATMGDHIEVVCPLKSGGLVAGASSLTGRYWGGSVWYWREVRDAPDVQRCTAACEVATGVVDLSVIDSKHIVLVTDSGSLEVYDLQVDENNENSLSCVAQMCEHDDIASSVSVNSAHTTAVTGSYDCRIKVWDLAESACRNTYRAHSSVVHDVACHPSQNEMFISCSQDGKVLLWDMRQSKPASYIDIGVEDIVTCVEWLHQAEHGVVIGTQSGTVHMQDVRQSVGPQQTTYPHVRAVTRMGFSHHRNDWLSTASEDCNVTVQYIASDDLSEVWRSSVHRDFARCAAWSPCDDRLYSCGWDGQVVSHTPRPATETTTPKGAEHAQSNSCTAQTSEHAQNQEQCMDTDAGQLNGAQ